MLLPHGDVDAGAGNLVDGGNGPRQLAFERAAVVHLLEELRLPEVGAVEELEPDAAARRQSLAGELEAQLVHPVLGHADGAAAVDELVGHLLVLRAATTATPNQARDR